MPEPTDDEQPLSYSRAKRQMGLSHVRDARARIDQARQAEPQRLPRKPDPASASPAPAHPVPMPASEPAATGLAPATAAESLVDRIAELEAAVDALSAKYEMEIAAHRDSVEKLLASKDAHIASLDRLVAELMAERAEGI